MPRPAQPHVKYPTAWECLNKVWHSKVVDNDGSEARDNLANERTFMAWLRTSFNLAAIGILISRVIITGQDDSNRILYKVLSIWFLVIGMLCVIAGSLRYAHVTVLLQMGKYPTSGVAFMWLVILGLGAFLATFVALVL